MVFDFDLAHSIKKLFKGDNQKIDNFIFSLHHKYSFALIIFGIVFIAGQNYLNTNAITCKGGDEYQKQFCYLHGSSHIPADIKKALNPNTKCTPDDESADKLAATRTSSYYIWLPFALAFCALITKLPRVLWKNVLESEIMKRLTEDCKSDKDDAGSKSYKYFFKKKSFLQSKQAMVYNLAYLFCECLNLGAAILNMEILNRLLNKEFSNYGTNVNAYWAYDPKIKEQNPGLEAPHDPKCHLFPTEVSCNVDVGSISGGIDKKNILCLLTFNVFNQYYFLVLWWWWYALIIISAFGLVYRAVQMLVAPVGKRLLQRYMDLMVTTEDKLEIKLQDLNQFQVFLLSRLVKNLKGSELMNPLMDEKDREMKKEKDKKKEEEQEKKKKNLRKEVSKEWEAGQESDSMILMNEVQ